MSLSLVDPEISETNAIHRNPIYSTTSWPSVNSAILLDAQRMKETVVDVIRFLSF